MKKSFSKIVNMIYQFNIAYENIIYYSEKYKMKLRGIDFEDEDEPPKLIVPSEENKKIYLKLAKQDLFFYIFLFILLIAGCILLYPKK